MQDFIDLVGYNFGRLPGPRARWLYVFDIPAVWSVKGLGRLWRRLRLRLRARLMRVVSCHRNLSE